MKKGVVTGLGVLLSMGAGVASAALPTEATTAFTDLGGAVTDTLAAVWPLAAAVMVGFVTLKLVKKGVNKAT